jgi:hypothetical protein
MPRKKSGRKPFKVTITSTPKLGLYLNDLKGEEGYGNSPSEVARTLAWRGIEELIARGVLDRRKGPPEEADGRA